RLEILDRRLRPRGRGRSLGLFADDVLEDRQALGEHLRLIGEPRDRGREMQKEGEDEEQRDDEERVRRAVDAHELGEAFQAVSPRRQRQQDDAARQPQQRVALEQATPADELEYDEQKRDGGEDGHELKSVAEHQMPCPAATGSRSPASTTGRARARPTNSARSTLIM